MKIKRIVLIASAALAVLLCLNAFSGEAKKPLPLNDDTRRAVKNAIEKVAQGQGAEVDEAVEKLVTIGPAALPALEQEIATRRKSILPFIAAIERIRIKWKLPGKSESAETDTSPAPEEYFRRRFEEAKKLYEEKNFSKASIIAQAILALEPQTPMRRDLVNFVAKCEERMFQKTTLRVSIDLENSVVELGSDIEFSISIANLSGNTVELKSFSDSSQPFVRLKRLDRLYAMNGDFRKDYFPVRVDIPENIILKPGKAWIKKLVIPTSQTEINAKTFRRMSLEGHVRPGCLLVDGKEAGRMLFFNTVTVAVVPKGYLETALTPLKALKQALKDATPPCLKRRYDDYKERIFISSHMLDREFHSEAVDIMVGRLRKVHDSAQRTLMVSLRAITGEMIPYEVEEWEEWYTMRELGK